MVWCCGYCLLSVFCVYDLWNVFVFTFNSVVVMLFFSYRLCCVLCFLQFGFWVVCFVRLPGDALLFAWCCRCCIVSMVCVYLVGLVLIL